MLKQCWSNVEMVTGHDVSDKNRYHSTHIILHISKNLTSLKFDFRCNWGFLTLFLTWIVIQRWKSKSIQKLAQIWITRSCIEISPTNQFFLLIWKFTYNSFKSSTKIGFTIDWWLIYPFNKTFVFVYCFFYA